MYDNTYLPLSKCTPCTPNQIIPFNWGGNKYNFNNDSIQLCQRLQNIGVTIIDIVSSQSNNLIYTEQFVSPLGLYYRNDEGYMLLLGLDSINKPGVDLFAIKTICQEMQIITDLFDQTGWYWDGHPDHIRNRNKSALADYIYSWRDF